MPWCKLRLCLWLTIQATRPRFLGCLVNQEGAVVASMVLWLAAQNLGHQVTFAHWRELFAVLMVCYLPAGCEVWISRKWRRRLTCVVPIRYDQCTLPVLPSITAKSTGLARFSTLVLSYLLRQSCYRSLSPYRLVRSETRSANRDCLLLSLEAYFYKQACGKVISRRHLVSSR